MTVNKEFFVEDPTAKNIPNLGVTKVGEPEDAAGWDVLRYELKSFVCEGSYEDGLDRILTSFLAQAGGAQTAAWVSGFYGSGKSHLVRALEHMWRDRVLPDGSTSRGLLRVPQRIEDSLRELSTLGQRNGGLWSAAGTLDAGAGSVRLAFLRIVLKAAGLPADLAQARCVMWLRDEGLYDQVSADVIARGLDWDTELDNMYVSMLAESILAARPGWATGADGAREQLFHAFPEQSDLTLDETVKVIERVLHSVSTREGKFPCSLVVLDEVQQFINEDPDRALQVQLLIERCSMSFDGLLMVVATGQAALQSTAVLQRLIDRFHVQVQLSEADVDSVIREVLLRKRPDRIAELKSVLEASAGEIDRQLAGSRIAPVPSDEQVLEADYPLLPSRRRFWEAVLRAVDKAGKAGQLRSQLRVVHEANRLVAEESAGTVVAADYIFDAKAADMRQTGVLLADIQRLIEEERRNPDKGELRSRVLALVFLISQLPREGFADTGVRPTASHIADLLVDDLANSGQELRREVEPILDRLQSEAKVLRVDDEYLLQTPAGQEWTTDFRNRRSAFVSDIGRVAYEREAALRKAVISLTPRQRPQGASKTARQVDIAWADTAPAIEVNVPVWVRSGWELTEKQFNDLAASAGQESPLVLVYLPKVEADSLADALADVEAASETINTRPAPTTDEGLAARRAMESTREQAAGRLGRLVEDVLRSAAVVQAGGNRVAEGDLGRSLASAIDRAVVRLYPRFGDADNGGWSTAWTRALQSNEGCLEAVGHTGAAAQHPVCKAILESIGAAGTTGNDIRKKFEAPAYGWPRDAIHAALAALVLATELNAEENGTPVAVSQFKPNAIGKLVFRRESAAVSLPVRLAVAGVLSKAGITVVRGEEAAGSAALIVKLADLSREAGGDAPLPAPPKLELLDDLRKLKGNELILAINEHSHLLNTTVEEWGKQASLKAGRVEAFSKAHRLVSHLTGNEGGVAKGQLEAVTSNRSLLQTPDPVPPIVSDVVDALRAELLRRVEEYNSTASRARETLDLDDAWRALGPTDQDRLLAQQDLRDEITPVLGTPSEVLIALDARPLQAWSDRTAAVTERIARIREAVAKLSEPKAFRTSAPSASLRSVDDVEAFVSSLRQQLLDELADHKFLIL
ncbi:BREX system P-loop protein BrxC [Mycolicibacterium sphagni]|uniref:BREX system P-loop protein BrxC n=1 Tax=Mycolicibacterium sphagni TaxID=1786 RepID=UPI0021F369E0|nr:BREX system P-loop protein BrxC [Mycolicibacterium sphagni]MCV7176149.1 BREX system P-loop protein BrxC [Mycolicibacterium sphagni]